MIEEKYENNARDMHKNGNNCSYSVYNALMKDYNLSGDFPAPRSREGICGAVLAAEKILKELSLDNYIAEFEEEFVKEFGYLKCRELMKKDRRCNDYVGFSAHLVSHFIKSKQHEMKLNDEPFNSIKHGTKTIELRLNDHKRQLLKINDIIEFTNRKTLEKMLVIIEGLYKYPSFDELYKHFDKIDLGYQKNEVANPKDMEQYYSKKQQDQYGVVGIKIKKLSSL